MLVLTRKVGEVIHVGDDIEIMLVRVNSNSCRIGIKAPRSIPIERDDYEPKPPPVMRETIPNHSFMATDGDHPKRVVWGKLGKCDSGPGVNVE